jgi:site-specific DNA-cytosine methylase
MNLENQVLTLDEVQQILSDHKDEMFRGLIEDLYEDGYSDIQIARILQSI